MFNSRLAIGLAATVLLAGACSGGGDEGGHGTAAIKITPVNGAGDARPDQGVTVDGGGAKLVQVNVQAGGQQAPGDFNADHTRWKTRWTLTPGTAYQVSAAGKKGGKTITAASRFTTVRPATSVSISDVTPQPSEKVGIGMPIIVLFSQPVANKDFVERSLEVGSDKHDEGSWNWISSTEVVYRTKNYWQPHQNVTLTAHFAGVRAARDVYGLKDVTRSFQIGASTVAVADSKTHYMTVKHEGVTKRFPISTGNGSTREYTTTSGIHLTKEKDETVTMTSPGRSEGDAGYYSETVHLAVRISDRGEYVHQSVGEYGFLGNSNQSHGCVRTSPEGARWFYDIAQRGDIVDVTGTSRSLADEPGNGWTFWTTSWPKWQAGSALHH